MNKDLSDKNIHRIKMNRTVGMLKEGEEYELLLDYGNELNILVDALDEDGHFKPLFMDKRDGHRVFDYIITQEKQL